MAQKRAIHKVLAGAGFALFPQDYAVGISIVATATDNFPLVVVPVKCKLISGSLFVSTDADGDKSAVVQNLTKAVPMTASLDVDAIAADSAASFVLHATPGNHVANAGDRIALVYTVTTAGAVQPGISVVTLRFQLL